MIQDFWKSRPICIRYHWENGPISIQEFDKVDTFHTRIVISIISIQYTYWICYYMLFLKISYMYHTHFDTDTFKSICIYIQTNFWFQYPYLYLDAQNHTHIYNFSRKTHPIFSAHPYIPVYRKLPPPPGILDLSRTSR